MADDLILAHALCRHICTFHAAKFLRGHSFTQLQIFHDSNIEYLITYYYVVDPILHCHICDLHYLINLILIYC